MGFGDFINNLSNAQQIYVTTTPPVQVNSNTDDGSAFTSSGESPDISLDGYSTSSYIEYASKEGYKVQKDDNGQQYIVFDHQWDPRAGQWALAANFFGFSGNQDPEFIKFAQSLQMTGLFYGEVQKDGQFVLKLPTAEQIEDIYGGLDNVPNNLKSLIKVETINNTDIAAEALQTAQDETEAAAQDALQDTENTSRGTYSATALLQGGASKERLQAQEFEGEDLEALKTAIEEAGLKDGEAYSEILEMFERNGFTLEDLNTLDISELDELFSSEGYTFNNADGKYVTANITSLTNNNGSEFISDVKFEPSGRYTQTLEDGSVVLNRNGLGIEYSLQQAYGTGAQSIAYAAAVDAIFQDERNAAIFADKVINDTSDIEQALKDYRGNIYLPVSTVSGLSDSNMSQEALKIELKKEKANVTTAYLHATNQVIREDEMGENPITTILDSIEYKGQTLTDMLNSGNEDDKGVAFAAFNQVLEENKEFKEAFDGFLKANNMEYSQENFADIINKVGEKGLEVKGDIILKDLRFYLSTDKVYEPDPVDTTPTEPTTPPTEPPTTPPTEPPTTPPTEPPTTPPTEPPTTPPTEPPVTTCEPLPSVEDEPGILPEPSEVYGDNPDPTQPEVTQPQVTPQECEEEPEVNTEDPMVTEPNRPVGENPGIEDNIIDWYIPSATTTEPINETNYTTETVTADAAEAEAATEAAVAQAASSQATYVDTLTNSGEPANQGGSDNPESGQGEPSDQGGSNNPDSSQGEPNNQSGSGGGEDKPESPCDPLVEIDSQEEYDF